MPTGSQKQKRPNTNIVFGFLLAGRKGEKNVRTTNIERTRLGISTPKRKLDSSLFHIFFLNVSFSPLICRFFRLIVPKGRQHKNMTRYLSRIFDFCLPAKSKT